MKMLTAPLRFLVAAVMAASVFASGGEAAAQQRSTGDDSQSLAEFLRRVAADPSSDPRGLSRIAETVSQVALELGGRDQAQMDALIQERLRAGQSDDFMRALPIMMQTVKLIMEICGEGFGQNQDRCMAMIRARCAEPPSKALACLQAWAAGRNH